MKKITDEEFVDFTRKRLARKKKWCKALTILSGILFIPIIGFMLYIMNYKKGLFPVSEDDHLFSEINFGVMIGAVLGFFCGTFLFQVFDIFLDNLSLWIFKKKWNKKEHLMIKYYDLYNEVKGN